MGEAGITTKLKEQHLYLILQELSDSLNYTKRKANCTMYFKHHSMEACLAADREYRIDKFIQQKLDYID